MAFGFLGGFGSCPVCMRWAFRTALGAWLLLAIVTLLRAPWLLAAIAMAAGGLSLLWLTHLFAYSRKIALAFKKSATGSREAWPLFARSLGVAIALSVVSRRISADRIYRYFGFSS